MRLNVSRQLEHLQTVDESYWLDLFKQYLIDVSVKSKVFNIRYSFKIILSVFDVS